MKQFLVISNIVLIIASGILFYLHFSHETDLETQKKLDDARTKAAGSQFVYFVIDSVQNNYEYFKEVKSYLQSRNNGMEQKLEKMRNDYTSKINDFNKRGPSLSQTEQSQMQEDLMRMEGNFRQQQEQLGQELQNETIEKMMDVKTRIQDFLKTYSSKKGFVYVFATGSSDDVVYYKDTLKDITKDLLIELNKDHLAKKNK